MAPLTHPLLPVFAVVSFLAPFFTKCSTNIEAQPNKQSINWKNNIEGLIIGNLVRTQLWFVNGWLKQKFLT